MSDYTVENADTVVEIILDRSGSMEACRNETIEGINAYIDNLKQNKPGNVMVGLTQFDSEVNYRSGTRTTRLRRTFFKALSDIKHLTRDDFVPEGGTPLYDAVGKVIKDIDVALENHQGDTKPNLLLLIVTDGGNTDGHGYSAEETKTMIEQRQNDGWTVVYLGANQNAWAVGSTFGIAQGNAMTYSTKNMGQTFRSMADSTVAYASASASAGSGYATRSFFADAGLSEKDFEEK